MGHALLELGSRSFYAQQDARIPLLASALNAGVYLILAFSLTRQLGFVGISLATSLAFTGEALLLLYLLNRRYSGILSIRDTIIRVGLAGLAGGLVALGVMRVSVIPAVVTAVGALGLGGLATLPFIWPEMRLLARL
jgi:putative peptidoglycan lipid II flippase